MSLSLGFVSYAIKKGLTKDKIFIIYATFYLIVCTLLVITAQFKAVGIVAVLIVYLIRIMIFKKSLNRIVFS